MVKLLKIGRRVWNPGTLDDNKETNVWDTYGGKNVNSIMCFSCGMSEISRHDHHIARIGDHDYPICGSCRTISARFSLCHHMMDIGRDPLKTSELYISLSRSQLNEYDRKSRMYLLNKNDEWETIHAKIREYNGEWKRNITQLAEYVQLHNRLPRTGTSLGRWLSHQDIHDTPEGDVKKMIIINMIKDMIHVI